MTFKKRTCIHIDWHELEDAIEKHYGQRLDIPCDLESSNDVAYTFDLTKSLYWDEHRIQGWLQDDRECYMTRDLLNKMASEGAIPREFYVMEISW